MKSHGWMALALLSAGGVAHAQDPSPAPIPAQVRALEGCWQGNGAVMGKSVVISLSARPITAAALFLVEADSHATSDPADRYAAHLIFGGHSPTGKAAGQPTISAFWADSFGGDFTAVGAGSAGPSGFEVAYAYPDATYVNRWRLSADRLAWTIVARSGAASETTFASYELKRAVCSRDARR
jgi:hypothetical protein